MTFFEVLSKPLVVKSLMAIGGVLCVVLGCIPLFAPQQAALWAFGTYLFGRVQRAPGDG
jgi:hypothetical protein